ncbi:hypothetical protein Q8791_23505 [Nocardiopsis sp. CT-R113]|uniref:Uncharacterized protein n=1 Tax=Nocardiopsis codii TaxID=3065942 RepID=A0ABU7KD73_9ACTN|nr:hypothetical protein [Nocardiopsis sp. CT-R113]MEE2040188.1 hypothetical protein [Nocardiopsis sp. CT-R113]
MFAWFRLLLRREVIVNLHNGTGFRGVLYRKAGRLVELRNATRLEPGLEPAECDGAVILERSEVEFWQVIRS